MGPCAEDAPACRQDRSSNHVAIWIDAGAMAMRSDLLSDNQRARNRWDDDGGSPREVPHVDRAPGQGDRPLVGGGALAFSAGVLAVGPAGWYDATGRHKK